MMKAKILIVGMMLAGLSATTAWGDILFTTSGTTTGGSVSGSANFALSGGDIIVTLTNTSSVTAVAQVLDALNFTLTGGSGLTLIGVAANGFEDCTGASCAAVSSFVNQSKQTLAGCAPGTCGSPYTWTYSAPLLAAGAGSYKPGGIVNTGITQADGLPNAEHNDYLVGPVTFTFSYTTAPTGVTSTTFFWGTTPETTTGVPPNGTTFSAPVPDGGMTVMLLGGALVGLEALRRKVRA